MSTENPNRDERPGAQWAQINEKTAEALRCILSDGQIDARSREALKLLYQVTKESAALHHNRVQPISVDALHGLGDDEQIGWLSIDYATYMALERAHVRTIGEVREMIADGSITNLDRIGFKRAEKIAQALERDDLDRMARGH